MLVQGLSRSERLWAFLNLSLSFNMGGQHMNPLDTISGTIIAGVILAFILTYVIKLIAGV